MTDSLALFEMCTSRFVSGTFNTVYINKCEQLKKEHVHCSKMFSGCQKISTELMFNTFCFETHQMF